MTAEPPRYANNWRLARVRRIRDPEHRFRKASALQDYYWKLGVEAGNIKMGAADDVYRETHDFEEAANRIGRDAKWVAQAVKVLEESREVEDSS